jgi:hypothetical protein
MTNKDIQNLIDKYLAGETSPAEERQLTLALHQHQELPEEWQTVSLMLGELTLGEAEYDAIMAQRHHKPSPLIIALRTVSSIAAAWLIGLFLYQQATVSEPLIQSNEVPHYYTSNLTAGSTLKDVYTSRQQRDQFISYTQFRQMRYENK